MKYLVLLLVLTLAACTTTAPKIQPIEDADLAWEKRKADLYLHADWVAHLSLVGVTEQEKFKTRIIWQQQQEDYQIKLRDFIGRTVALIEGSPHKVVVKTSKGERYEDQNAETLIYGLFGLRIPVAGMRYWLQGVPQPDQEYSQLLLRADGLAQNMQQSGWQLSYQTYAEQEPVQLPTRAVFEFDDLALTVNVSRWDLTKQQ